MRLELICGAVLVAGLVAAGAVESRAQPRPAVPVVVELFTSEGCSDCPPADAVLAKLASERSGGVEVIALGEHVDYWDRQGWRDPFSSAAFTARQIDYTRALRVESPYTPQMIVNGRDEFVGSNEAEARRAIASAGRSGPPRVRVSIQPEPASGRAVVPVHVEALLSPGATLRGSADVIVAVTEDNLSSQVTAGENKGRRLQHVAVVRSMSRAGTLEAKGTMPWSGGGEVAIEPGWNVRALHVVAFVQERTSRAILGAASVQLPAEK
jgi:hypothetical protein